MKKGRENSIKTAKAELADLRGCVGDLMIDKRNRVWVVCHNRAGRDKPYRVSNGRETRLWSNNLLLKSVLESGETVFHSVESEEFASLARRFTEQVAGFFSKSPANMHVEELIGSADGDSHPHPMRRGRAPYPQE